MKKLLTDKQIEDKLAAIRRELWLNVYHGQRVVARRTPANPYHFEIYIVEEERVYSIFGNHTKADEYAHRYYNLREFTDLSFKEEDAEVLVETAWAEKNERREEQAQEARRLEFVRMESSLANWKFAYWATVVILLFVGFLIWCVTTGGAQ